MTPKPSGQRPALERPERARPASGIGAWSGDQSEVFSEDYASKREALFQSPELPAAEMRPPQDSTGAVLERELLMVNTEGLLPRPRSWRWLRVLLLLLLLGAVGAGASFGLWNWRKDWRSTLGGLQGRIQFLEDESQRQREVFESTQARTQTALETRRSESERLAALMEETLEELQSNVGKLQELRKEKDALEARYRQLAARSAAKPSTLSRFYPRWLFELRPPETPDGAESQ